ncbi:MAG: EamA family transporter [Arcobacter sp.]|jgi:drug/metabolite transporter (DMT)-like permease|uniref:EamA family transporter n=2 Tax=Poseidonibacter ostreae TaxID=2654171 RepID=A0A6L4WVW3_9BACT|nr:EamA family transporter [Poseidonibacter ostreae]KAB7887864.1 EamA family transporter [Poseidonibacter ostreae]KAB7890005.1 EamA family transporter [Poseidonibacter ostreae]MAC83555.1 EamA family transporter [Arcobacter sp.]|tara:strand:+ start:137 stop:1084 length:948 start_codon:yes stop_codon:yes gene_type:complete
MYNTFFKRKREYILTKNFSYIGILSLVFAMFIWASSFIALKTAINDLEPYTVIFLRMLLASLCFVYFIKDFIKYDFSKSDIKYIILLAFFEPCLYFIFEAKAIQLTTASQVGMITSLMPIITAIAAGYFLKEIISKQLVIGSLIALCGAVWLSLQAVSSVSAPNPILGNFFELLAMVCGAGYTIVARYLSEKYSALFITAIQVFIGTIFFFPFFLYEYTTTDLNFTTNAILCVVYLGVVVTLGGYGLYNYALTKIEASKAAVFIYLIPVFTLILAYLLLDEKLSITEFIACITILFGVFISETPLKKILKFINRK